MRHLSQVGLTVLLSLAFVGPLYAAKPGESAVITLVFPPGARATGMGESFTAVADDANATYFNPAGLGQSPLANAWHAFSPAQDVRPTVVAARKKKSFGSRGRVWVGTNKGLYKYNGRSWTGHETYLIEENDNLQKVVERFLDIKDEEILKTAKRLIKRENAIDLNRTRYLRTTLRAALGDSASFKTNQTLDDVVDALLDLGETERTLAGVYGLLATLIDTVLADSLDDIAVKAFEIGDVTFEDLVELKVPFSIAVRDSITALELDGSDRLWVGTANGLWRYDGASWMRLTTLDGLPSEKISSIAIGPNSEVAVGTDAGLAVLKDGRWFTYGEAYLPHPFVAAIAFAEPGVLYVGTPGGLTQKKDSLWTSFDTADGLLAIGVTSLMFDSNKRLWIGGRDGVSVYDKNSWKRYKFPDSEINSITEFDEERVWIGTDRGAIAYTAGRSKTTPDGSLVQSPPMWKFFHAKNALTGSVVRDISVQGKDVWMATDQAVNQYDHADKQFMVFYEQLLPAFRLPDLWHIYLAGVIPTEDWGTIGALVNYINFGEIELTNEQGAQTGFTHSWEAVFGLSYGLPIKEDLSVGLTLKYVHSALAPGYDEGDEGIGRTIAVDAAVLKRNLFVDGLHLGFMLQNMGPPIYYISRDDADPIPFNLRLGLAYEIVNTPLIRLQALTDINHEIAHKEIGKRPDPFWRALYSDLFQRRQLENGTMQSWTDKAGEEIRELIGHAGLEFWYADFLALRMGYLHDEAGYRRELAVGVGLSYGNLSFDGSYIHAPKGSEARHGQWRLSLMLKI